MNWKGDISFTLVLFYKNNQNNMFCPLLKNLPSFLRVNYLPNNTIEKSNQEEIFFSSENHYLNMPTP